MTRSSAAIETIAQNIKRWGYHVYVVRGATCPRWVYTVGLYPRFGSELVFAGGLRHTAEQARRVISEEVARLEGHPSARQAVAIATDASRRCTVHPDWVGRLLLGANDFYGCRVNAVQIVPDAEGRTIDVPDMALPFPEGRSPWSWLDSPWQFAVPAASEAMIDKSAAFGEPVTEVGRWEENYWEATTGPISEAEKADATLVPLSTLLGMDPSLDVITRLAVGEALYRESGADWKRWEVNK